MPSISHLRGKHTMLKLRDTEPILALVSASDEHGVWIEGAGDLVAKSGLLQKIQMQKPTFFVPWTSVDWIVMQAE